MLLICPENLKLIAYLNQDLSKFIFFQFLKFQLENLIVALDNIFEIGDDTALNFCI